MLEVSAFERVADVEERISEIQSRISALSGAAPVSGSSPAFAARLEVAMASRPAHPAAWDGLIQEASAQFGLEESLLSAVMMSESGGNPNAVSKAGAVGLMQLMPATAESLGISDPLDPRQNVLGGARYLRGLLDRFGSEELAVAAYNAGPGAVKRYGGIPPYAETQNYVATVMARARGGTR